jgi:septal ring factor EnvC (AmiA/AmiB activator)
MSLDQAIELLKVVIVPVIAWMANSLRKISNDINQIKTSLAQNEIRHEDLRSDVDDMKRTQESRSETISKMREDISYLKKQI